MGPVHSGVAQCHHVRSGAVNSHTRVFHGWVTVETFREAESSVLEFTVLGLYGLTKSGVPKT